MVRVLSFRDSARRALTGLAAAGLLSLALVGGVAAQDIAAAGNGGTADASAAGGAVLVDDVNSGANSGSDVAVGDVHDGSVAVDGGQVSTSTGVGIGADGGIGIADASGGDENVAIAVE